MTAWWYWLLWGLVLVAQNAAFTWMIRARGSGDLGWHRLATYSAQVTWILNLGLGTNQLLLSLQGHRWGLFVGSAVFYTVVTAEASVLAHRLLLRVEDGKRRVGA